MNEWFQVMLQYLTYNLINSLAYLKELWHDSLHTHQRQYYSQQGGRREGDIGVKLQHLQQIHYEDKYLVLGVAQ